MTKVREKAKTNNLEPAEPIPTEFCSNVDAKRTIFRDESIRHDGPNDASAPLQACHPPEVGQGGASAFQSTKKRTDPMKIQIEDGIFDAINVLRYHSKKRPDQKSITDHIAKKLGADRRAVLQALHSLSDAERVHVKEVKGKDSCFIGKNPSPEKSHESTEAEDQNNDSFLEFLDGIETPVKGIPSNTLQLVPEESSANPFLATINKLIDNNSLIQNLLNTEIGINKDLTDQNTELKLRIQSLENCLNEIANVKQVVHETAASKAPETLLANNESIVPEQITSSADNSESPMDCAEQSIKDQWEEVRIKKHNEFVYLKSLETKQKAQPGDLSPKTMTKATLEVAKVSQGNKRSKKKTQQKRNNTTTSSELESKSENTQKILLLGDSHVRRLDEKKLLAKSIAAKGIGGIKSDQIISRHKQTINSELQKFEEVIIHIGSNDISKGIPVKKIIDNVDTASQRLQEVKPCIKITLSSIFLQGYDPPKNVNVVEANQALKRYCLTKGWDFIDHGNIAFKHLDKGGMHLTPEGNRLFARNLLAHTKSG